MSTTLSAAPAVVRASVLADSIKVEPLTCSIGALLSNVNLGIASRDSARVAEIRALLPRPEHQPRRTRGLRAPLR